MPIRPRSMSARGFALVALMTLALDFPECSRSPLGQVDPRWKLVALFLAVILVALLRGLAPAACALVAAVVLAALAKLPWRWYLVRLGSVALVLSFLLAWLPFVHPAGWSLALTLLLKALAILSLMLSLLATAPLQDTFKA